MTYTYYQSPYGGIAHLSRNRRYTLCGYSIRAGWTETTATSSRNCSVCRRIELAEAAVGEPLLRPAPPAQEAAGRGTGGMNDEMPETT